MPSGDLGILVVYHAAKLLIGLNRPKLDHLALAEALDAVLIGSPHCRRLRRREQGTK
jgi:hypothetical protein